MSIIMYFKEKTTRCPANDQGHLYFTNKFVSAVTKVISLPNGVLGKKLKKFVSSGLVKLLVCINI